MTNFDRQLLHKRKPQSGINASIGLFINKFHIWCLRMCAGGFELILQVSSTLWPDINRRNYQTTDSGSNGPSVAQESSSNHSRQAKPNWVKTRRPRTACWTKFGAIGPPGRPTDLLVGRLGPWAPPPQLQNMACNTRYKRT